MTQFIRVSPSRRCPVCQREDWCLFTGPADRPQAAICARVESANRRGDAGWLHRLHDDDGGRAGRRVLRVKIDAGHDKTTDFAGLSESYRRCVDPERLARFARGLGLAAWALERFGVGWSPAAGAWSFPMRSAAGGVRGVHLRKPDGRKLAVRGSKMGLFMPLEDVESNALLVAEGLTDAAALCEMGFLAIGRPSCSSGVGDVVALVRSKSPSEVVVVADGDAPGRRGAGNLASVLVAYAASVRVTSPPDGIKDIRDWALKGCSRADVEQIIEAAPARRLNVRLAGQEGGHP